MPVFKDVFKVIPPGKEAPPATAPGEVYERIRKDVDANKILIYMKGTPDFPQCGFSAATIEVFNELGVPYETRDVLRDPDIRQGIKQYSNWPTIPQVYVNGKFIGGCDIVTELHTRGELAPIIQEALKK